MDNTPKGHGDLSIEDGPDDKKQKLDKNGIINFKLASPIESEADRFKSQIKSSLKPNEEIASTSTQEIFMLNNCDESKPSLPNINLNHVQVNLIEIEKLSKKYFRKHVQDNIVSIANILNLISISNNYHKARMDKSLKKITKAERIKERYFANQLHKRHIKTLETKLKKYFIEVISSFAELEFELAFHMLFLCILAVFQSLYHPTSKKGIFKRLVFLLWKSLKISKDNHPKMYSMFRSKKFRSDIINLMRVIKYGLDTDPIVIHCMSLFFESTANGREYFQAAINAVTRDLDEDLAELIDIAISHCHIYSIVKDPVDA